MFPFIFDWDGSIARYVFMGALYGVLTLIGVGLGIAFHKTTKDLSSGDTTHEHH